MVFVRMVFVRDEKFDDEANGMKDTCLIRSVQDVVSKEVDHVFIQLARNLIV